MSRDLRQLLDDAAAPPARDVDVEEVRRRGDQLRRRRRATLAGGAAAVVAAAAAAVTVPVLGDGPDDVVVDPRPEVEPTPSPTGTEPDATGGAVPELSIGAWERVEDPDLGTADRLERITDGARTGSGAVVAVGAEQVEGGAPRAAVWRTDDGRDWVRVDADAFAAEEGVAAADAAADGEAVVAVGGAGRSEVFPGPAGERPPSSVSEQQAAAWRSTDDGHTWQRWATADIEDGAEARMSAVAHGPAGFLAVGTRTTGGETVSTDPPKAAPPGSAPAVWQAPDATSGWQRLETDLPAEADSIRTFAANDDRYVVAVDVLGEQGATSEDQYRDVELYWSDDAASWQPVEDVDAGFTAPGDQTVSDVLTTADGTFVAVGRESTREQPGGTDVVWASPDGRRWYRVAAGVDVPLAATGFVQRRSELFALTMASTYETETLVDADAAVFVAPLPPPQPKEIAGQQD